MPVTVGKREMQKNHLRSSLGVPVNTNLVGGGWRRGVLKGWEGPEKVKPREVREACLLAHIPHRIERPHGILPQCVSERGIDSNQEWEVRPGEELQGI